MDRYALRSINLSSVLEPGNTSFGNYTPTISYKAVNTSDGYYASQSTEYNNINAVPLSVTYWGQNGWGYNEYYADQTNYPTGTTRPSVEVNLDSYVRNHNYQRLRCILVGAGGGGGGSGASNTLPGGAGGGSGAFAMFDLWLPAKNASSQLRLSVGGAGNGGIGTPNPTWGNNGGNAGNGGATSLTFYNGATEATQTVNAGGGGGGRGGAQDWTNLGYGANPGGGGTVGDPNGIGMIYNFSGKTGGLGANGNWGNVPGAKGPLVDTTAAQKNNIGNTNVITFQDVDIVVNNYYNLPAKFQYVYNWNTYALSNSAGGAGGRGGRIHSKSYGHGGGPGSAGYARIFFIT